MSELISIREASRRLGVSDTAVHKAIKSGRVTIAGRSDGSGRPLLAWPECEADWLSNSDGSKRTHVGSQGGKNRGDGPPVVQLPTNLEPAAPAKPPATRDLEQIGQEIADGDGDLAIHDGMSLMEAKTAREIYNARLSRIEYEQQIGKLVDAKQVKDSAFALARTVRDSMLNIPDRVAAEIAHETDPSAVHMRLTAEIRTALEALSKIEA